MSHSALFGGMHLVVPWTVEGECCAFPFKKII